MTCSRKIALVGARGDVQEAHFVGAFAVVARRDLDRVACVAQSDEVDALHHPPALTSRQGITRFASGTGYSFPSALFGGRLRGLEIDLAFVERAPGDDADDALGHELLAHELDVLHAGEATGSDDRGLQLLRELERWRRC